MWGRLDWSGLGGLLAAAAMLIGSVGPANAVPMIHLIGMTDDLHFRVFPTDRPNAGGEAGSLLLDGRGPDDADPEQLDLSDEPGVQSYYDVDRGSCATDVGSHCTVSFATKMAFAVEADLDDADAFFPGGARFQIVVDLAVSGGVDVTLGDPKDEPTPLEVAPESAPAFAPRGGIR